MPRQHVWTERDEDGIKREIRAIRFGGVWRFQSKRADNESWTYHKRPLVDDLAALKHILERKYRRRRATADELLSIQRLLCEHEHNE
jgi:hypothetical protein